jgi:hypothetical protein
VGELIDEFEFSGVPPISLASQLQKSVDAAREGETSTKKPTRRKKAKGRHRKGISKSGKEREKNARHVVSPPTEVDKEKDVPAQCLAQVRRTYERDTNESTSNEGAKIETELGSDTPGENLFHTIVMEQRSGRDYGERTKKRKRESNAYSASAKKSRTGMLLRREFEL